MNGTGTYNDTKSILSKLSAALVIAVMAMTASAADNPGKGQFYISPGAVSYEGPDDSRVGHDDGDIGIGLILGYGLSDHWSIEVMGARVESDFENQWGQGEDDVDLKWLDFLYKFDTNSEWKPFWLIGGGRTEYEFDGVRPDAKDNQFNTGVGVFRSLSDRISFRADVRAVTSNKTGGVQPFAFMGITGFLGDVQPSTPPADSDGDGVPNSKDKCPTTAPGRVVDKDGCAIDVDGDGVLNADDQCPDTPPGRTVDSRGCQLDGDGDGVVDADDNCKNTPKGVAVNKQGCPPDADGDGVPDYLDKCPGSERGAKVDAQGCYLELEEEVTIDMNIEFETNKAEIRPDHTAELNRAVKFLREYPTTNAVIEGHTDSDGAASYNQGLSEQRAKAVYEYLINQAGVKATRLDWAGFGETRPIADNNSADGKQRNRRVSAVVSGTHKVRQK